MKKKLLLLGAVLLSGLSGWAQTDVTSEYLKNADFEGEYTTEAAYEGSTNTIATPNGWTLDFTCSSATNKLNYSFLEKTDANYKNYSAMARTEGNEDKTYYIHLRWNESTLSLYQSVTLPKGTYTLSADMNAYETKSSDKNKMEIFAGDYKVASDKTTKKGNTWNTYSIKFTLTKETTMKIGLLMTQYSGSEFYACVDNFKLTYKENELADVKAALATAIAAVPSVPTEHVSRDIVFDYNKTQCDKITSTVKAAQAVYDNAAATLAELEEQYSAVVALTAPSLNAPSSSQAYKIVLKAPDWGYDNCAMTSRANDRTDMGLYNVQYLAKNDNYAQAMFFNQVDGGYNISWIDADGNMRYLCTGTVWGGSNGQIRTTTNKDDALLITITRNGDYINLYDVAAKKHIGSQDAGVYPVEKNIDFAVEETTTRHAITVSMTAGYATVCLPYAATISTGKAYTITAVGENNVLTMEETTSLEANKAYILEGSANYIFSGVNIAFKEPAVAEENPTLTGVYTDTTPAANTYVLQKHNGKMGFYMVDEFYDEGKAPTVGANHAYLTYTADQSTKAFFLNSDDATASDAINALTSGAYEAIYSANGARQDNLQKGMNIVKTANGKTAKIYIK